MSRKILKTFLILCVFVTAFMLSSCKKETVYNSYSEMESVIYQSILKQEEDKYMVFFYGNNCKYCAELESLLCSYATTASTKKSLLPLYVINASNTRVNKGLIASEGDDSYDVFVGTNNYQDIKISTTPALIVVENGVVTKLISSKVTYKVKTDIQNYIQSLIKK